MLRLRARPPTWGSKTLPGCPLMELWRLQLRLQCTQSLSCVWLFATPRTVARQAPLFMRFPKQEDWSGLPFPEALRQGIQMGAVLKYTHVAERPSCHEGETGRTGRRDILFTFSTGVLCNHYAHSHLCFSSMLGVLTLQFYLPMWTDHSCPTCFYFL